MVRILLKYDALLPLIGIATIILGVILNIYGQDHVELGYFTNSHLVSWLNLGPYWLSQLISGVFAFGVAFFLNRLVQTESLLGKISNVSFFLVCCMFVLLPASYNHPVFWIGCMFQIVLLRQLLFLFSGDKIAREVFNSGLTMGGLGLFNPSFLLYYLISIRALLLSARMDIRKPLITLVAIAVPLYLVNSTLYLLDLDITFFRFGITADWGFTDTLNFLRSGLLLGISVLILIQTRIQVSKETMREKRRWSLISLSILFGVFSVLSFNYGYWLFTLAIPLSIALGRSLIFMKNPWLREALFILFIGLIYLFKIGA